MRTPRTTLPFAPVIVVEPGRSTETRFVGGMPVYVVVLPSKGLCASSTTGLSIPFAPPLRNLSNHFTASVHYVDASGADAGEMPGAWPRSPMYKRFGPFRTRYAACACSMSNRKSRRPWIISVGVVSAASFEIGERLAPSAFTVAMFVLVVNDGTAA